MRNVVLVCLVVFLSGCSRLMTSGVRQPPPLKGDAAAVDIARDATLDVQSHMKAYIDDPLSYYERPEIVAVLKDLKTINQETDTQKFLLEVADLQDDFDKLVALDLTLQQESAI